MPISFVHLSDIHFGQEKGSQLVIHNDVKERLIEDAARQVKAHAGGAANGIVVSGDIAYAGETAQYRDAAAWLDRLTAAVSCDKTAVQVVPGNHDIDLDGISSGCQMMLDAIANEGEARLDAFMEAELDRETFYNRFAAYRPFAEGYNCPLDGTGGNAGERRYPLASGRTLRIIGLNSALICRKKDIEGRLLLGARQHVLPMQAGEELVVICHHPLHWLQDSEEARRYISNRARVFVSGHEHNPKVRVETIKPGCDLMMLEAGAAVPPRAENGFTYTYNLLIFDWDEATDGLKVTIVPRQWSEDDKIFVADDRRLGGRKPTTVLGCPNFKAESGTASSHASAGVPLPPAPVADIVPADEQPGGEQMTEDFALLLLRFFRDLTPSQRLAILLKLKLLPDEWRDPLTHSIERRIVDRLAKEGRLAELEAAINELQSQSATERREAR
jgi:hypothetical protein